MKSDINDLQRSLDMYKQRASDLEREVKLRDTAMEQMRVNLEQAKNNDKKRLDAEKQRSETLERTVQRLEAVMLQLHSQLGLQKHEKRLRGERMRAHLQW